YRRPRHGRDVPAAAGEGREGGCLQCRAGRGVPDAGSTRPVAGAGAGKSRGATEGGTRPQGGHHGHPGRPWQAPPGDRLAPADLDRPDPRRHPRRLAPPGRVTTFVGARGVADMTYEESMRFLSALPNYEQQSPSARDLTLGPIRGLLELLGNPHHRLFVIHVAGSKGKGSVAAMLERILRHAGYRTGLYTS